MNTIQHELRPVTLRWLARILVLPVIATLLIVACTPAATVARAPLPEITRPDAPAMPAGFPSEPSEDASGCQYWIAPAPAGNNANPGTSDRPWATLEYAGENVPDLGCIVWVKDGRYEGRNTFHRRFDQPATFKAVNPYRAILEDSGSPLVARGARNLIFEGFRFRHNSPSASKMVIQVSRKDDIWSEEIIFRNNIFHDSYNDDLMKVHNGSRHILVEGNIFYNQGPTDQHMDVNSVTDVIIQDNIFFNDFAGSDRVDNEDTKHFIMIKDSNEADDGLLGTERVIVRRNVFLNWQGGEETMVKTGNDGKPYHEAKDILVENNLMIGNSPSLISAAFGVRGAKDVTFANNTIVGDLPSKAYAFRATITDLNPKNENIYFLNNIWSDATGSMGAPAPDESNEFSDGDPTETTNVVLDNNLYWNAGKPIPPGELVSPMQDDRHPLVDDPQLSEDHSNVILPRWDGGAFLSGNATIRQEFERLVELYGRLPASSPAVGAANPDYAPADDILGRPRSITPALGAYEGQIRLSGRGDLTSIFLWWTGSEVPGAVDYAINYWVDGVPGRVDDVPLSASSYTLTDMVAYSLYRVRLDVLNVSGQVLARSNELLVLTTDIHNYMPFVSKSRWAGY